jgi:glycerophosphoryl diester phosphodiesterase
MTPAHSQFAIFGHRGSPRRAAENTIASFDLAISEGADGFETDVRALSDGTLVLFHDHDVNGRPVESFRYEELAGIEPSLVRLEELLRYAGSAAMTLEIKRSGSEEAIAAMIERWEGVTVSSFDHRVLRRLRALGFRGALGVVFVGYLDSVASYARELDASVIYPEAHLVDRAMVDSCAAAAIAVVPWTVNRAAEWEHLLAIGCQGVITDFPAEAALWRRGAR